MTDLLSLRNKVCVVTGAGKGIGRATAKMLAAQGCRLALISRSDQDLVSLEKELALTDDELLWMAGDCASPEVVDEFVARVVDKYGVIDVLFNNAGMRFRRKFLDISYDEWNEVHNTNLGSTFLFCQAVGREMVKQRRGSIINMASIVGTLGLSELSGYASTKGAIISLTKSLAVEFAEYDIRVNVIAPGFCATSYAENFKKNKELYDFTISRTPLGRWGGSEDIANACIYLASDMSKYVTGETLTVDGGWSAW